MACPTSSLSTAPSGPPSRPPSSKPTPCRPHLRDNRIHFPPHSPGQRHPVIFLIHGGGFVLGTPSMDDAQAHLLAAKGYVVASLDYSLARFPTPLHDLAALISAVLADEELLPLMDTDRVAVSGFSAGATMTLALAQLPELKDRIKALVPIQPLTDWSGSFRDPARGRTSAWGTKEQLPEDQPMFNWAYVPVGVDLRNPLLSPAFASRADIPQPVFFVTGSDDSLCDEAALLARKLADEEAKIFDVTESWAADGVRYECVKDMPHSFLHFWVRPKGEAWQRRKKEAAENLWPKVTAWLHEVLDVNK
ncbi:Neutral cholesterol ester hydrolase 1 [Mycena venus]|uniref:Neutral cholesterol ester hydrolase 1 n=1 Tax=Mycena venus TaxID=2733690 RepID=A0A8H6YFQ0_9AGAR|nr:Neutral cholesterol ester hydrolase 1 [Mycena venus]